MQRDDSEVPPIWIALTSGHKAQVILRFCCASLAVWPVYTLYPHRKQYTSSIPMQILLQPDSKIKFHFSSISKDYFIDYIVQFASYKFKFHTLQKPLPFFMLYTLQTMVYTLNFLVCVMRHFCNLPFNTDAQHVIIRHFIRRWSIFTFCQE